MRTSGISRTWLLGALVAVAAVGARAQVARAAQVNEQYTKVVDYRRGTWSYFSADYEANTGEANALTVTAGGANNNPLKFHDDGATIGTQSNGLAVPYPGGFDGAAACLASGHDAKCYEVDNPAYVALNCNPPINFTNPLCPGYYASGFQRVIVNLGDGNDRLQLHLAQTSVPLENADFVDLGDGDDTIDARDGMAEQIDCGPGTDTAIVDASDAVTNCENVTPG